MGKDGENGSNLKGCDSFGDKSKPQISLVIPPLDFYIQHSRIVKTSVLQTKVFLGDADAGTVYSLFCSRRDVHTGLCSNVEDRKKSMTVTLIPLRSDAS